MKWLLGGLVLFAVSIVMRRLLRIGARSPLASLRFAPLPPELHALYHPVAQEVETHVAILGIMLNDAFEEKEAQRHEHAWHMMRLSWYEWERLAELNAGLLNVLSRHILRATTIVLPPGILARWFMSRTMIDFVRMHELMDQLVFNSRLRVQLQVRLLRRATATLTGEFRRTFRNGERIQDPSLEVWTRFDHLFHDFDLMAKETLLVFRTLLPCLTPAALREIGRDLQSTLKRGVRSPSALTEQ